MAVTLRMSRAITASESELERVLRDESFRE